MCLWMLASHVDTYRFIFILTQAQLASHQAFLSSLYPSTPFFYCMQSTEGQLLWFDKAVSNSVSRARLQGPDVEAFPTDQRWRYSQCLSQELKKVRHMSHQAEKGETHVSPSWDTCLTKLKKVRHSPSWKGDWDTSNMNAKIKGGSNRSV